MQSALVQNDFTNSWAFITLQALLLYLVRGSRFRTSLIADLLPSR